MSAAEIINSSKFPASIAVVAISCVAKMLDLRGRTVNAVFSAGLLAVCIICYVLYVLLYVSPETYHLDSLIHPNTGTISPSVAVGLITAVFSGATTAVITRCAEQSLWLRLSSTTPDRHALTVEEAHHLAQWSVSPLERILIYPLRGASWLLKLGGILLFTTAAINPVLLNGISQRTVLSTTVDRQPNTVPMITNRLDQGNSAYRGGQARDNPTVVASVAEMAKLTASILDVCTDDHCHISALTTAIRAECESETSPNPNGVGLIDPGDLVEAQYCSTALPDLCVSLFRSSPNTYANFTSYYHPDCLLENLPCPPGAWSTLFGVWVSGTDTSRDSNYDIHQVQCLLTYGNITVTQNGTNPPNLDRDSFVQADWRLVDGYGSFYQMNRIYAESGRENSPYTFSGSAVGTGDNTLYRNPIGYELLGVDANNNAETVARQIERNFDRATLSAYARQANASDLTITRATEESLYVYEPKVLLVLLIPLAATLLGVWGRWSVGDEDTVLAYSPIEIARRGPVRGLPQGEILAEAERERMRKWRVWGVREDSIREDGTRGVHLGFAAGEDANMHALTGDAGAEGKTLFVQPKQP